VNVQVKAWCYYESRLLGAHHGLISTYALETLVLYVFNKYHQSIDSPLSVSGHTSTALPQRSPPVMFHPACDVLVSMRQQLGLLASASIRSLVQPSIVVQPRQCVV
jgi:hypothetical protein